MRNIITAIFVLTVILETFCTISYMDGRIVEYMQQRGKQADLQARYDTLADNTDWLTYVDSEAKYQKGRK